MVHILATSKVSLTRQCIQWLSAVVFFFYLSLVRRLTFVTWGIISILPRVQLAVYTQSSGSLIGNRHWLGSVFKGAYMEQPMSAWHVSGLYTKEKSWKRCQSLNHKGKLKTVWCSHIFRFLRTRQMCDKLYLYFWWLWAAESLLHLHFEVAVELAAIQQGETSSCFQAILAPRIHGRVTLLLQGGRGGKHLV